MELPEGHPSSLDKKRALILLRSVVVVSTSYLIVFGESTLSAAAIAYIVVVILSNVALMLTPRHWFNQPQFSAALLLGDTVVVLSGLYLTVGCFSQDFLIIYFFTIFLTTATSSMAQIALGAAVISGLYGYWLLITTAHPLAEGEWLRLPFFFIVAVFYAYVTEETKHERWRRQEAERESDHLRFLLHLSDAFNTRMASRPVLAQIGTSIEAAFPRLLCTSRTGAESDARTGAAFLLTSNARTFGSLLVAAKDGSPLSAEEEQFCKVVAAVAANALYTAEQTGVANDGIRLKDEFLAVLSHELRSPLHSILGNADILADCLQEAADPFAEESIGRLRASACHLLHLIEEMLCFAELRAGRVPMALEAVDLNELFEDLGDRMSTQLAGQPIRFECMVAQELGILHTDRRKLGLIIDALLSNAVKFTHEGVVRLSARRAAQHVEIVVQDSGIGIEPDNVGPMFQEFRQLDASLTRRYDGLGLGLALAQELTSALGGSIQVESEPNRGSTFSLRLPCGQLPPAAPPLLVPGVTSRHYASAVS